MAQTPNRTTEERIRRLVEPIAEVEGCEVVAVLLTTDAGRFVLRVCIDKRGGVTVGDCTRVSRLLSPVLDVEDPVPGRYHLEVSSPGMERPLQRLTDFARFEGYRVRLRLDPGAGPRRMSGVLRGVDGDSILVERTGHVRSIPLVGVERASLILDLEEYGALAGLGPSDPPPPPTARPGGPDPIRIESEEEQPDDQ
ncbi:MAG: ribosome maturation factor RimP [Pseudomonadota bacterium]